MTDQKDNEFGFEEEGVAEEEFTIEESVPLAAADADMTGEVAAEFTVEVEDEGAVEEPRKSSMTRILLLVLILLVAGGGYFFFATEDPEPGGAAVKTAKQPISLPAKLSVKPAPASVPAVTEPSVPAPTTPPAKATETAAKPVAKTVAAASKPESSMPDAEAAAAQVKVATVPVVAEPTPAPAAPQGDYSVQVGAYLLQSNLKNAQKMAEQTGYLSRIEEARKLTKMTRLLYGRFSPAEAETRLAELREQSPAAFKIADGDQIAIYAGSYTSLDKARHFADLLYEKGVVLEEAAVEVQIPLYILKLGPFSDRAAAEQAAQKAEAVGLPAQVVKKPVQ